MEKLHAEIREEKKRGVEFPGDENVKAAMERHPAMLWEHQTDDCLPCRNCTAQNPQTHWRRNGTGAPPPEQLIQLKPEPTPQPPEAPIHPTSNDEPAHLSAIEGVPPGFLYIHSPLPSRQFFDHDAYAKDRKCDKDLNPDLLTDEGTSTG